MFDSRNSIVLGCINKLSRFLILAVLIFAALGSTLKCKQWTVKKPLLRALLSIQRSVSQTNFEKMLRLEYNVAIELIVDMHDYSY